MIKKYAAVFLLITAWTRLSAGDDFCGLRNTAFQSGELIEYTIFYNVIGIYVNAGSASFKTAVEKLGSKTVYHVTGDGASNSKYDWIFKVRDKYESFFDTSNLQPLKFIRNVNEGGYKKYENVSFNQQTNTAITQDGVFKVPNCVQDVLSSIYYARNIDFNKYKENDKIPFNMFLDNEVFNLYIRYLGKETIKTRFGKFRAIKFKPLLVKGTIFEGGEKMTVWVTDDANHIPVRIESPITVGSIKVDMRDVSNLRYPLSSKL
ncbi:MAG: ATP-dependent exoDNAse [Chitinophagaceae bacterium]|nr:ATP-dependent exoDNAse [Chitinophagaceae bacterium]